MIAIAYFSASGTVRAAITAISQAIAETDRGPVMLVAVDQMTDMEWSTLERADMIVFASPTYMGGPAAAFKAFMDQTGNAIWLNRKWHNKLAAGLTSGVNLGGDKLATLQALNVFAMQHGMIWVGQSDLGAPVLPDRPGINDTATFLGLTLTSTESGDLSPGDAASARLFGARLAEAEKRWMVGNT